jgi:hypothetical protein
MSVNFFTNKRGYICQHKHGRFELRSERGTAVFWSLAAVICWVEEIAYFHTAARCNFLIIWILTAGCTKWCRYTVIHPQEFSWRTSQLVRPRHYWRFWVRGAAVAVKKHQTVTSLFLLETPKIRKYIRQLYYTKYTNV